MKKQTDNKLNIYNLKNPTLGDLLATYIEHGEVPLGASLVLTKDKSISGSGYYTKRVPLNDILNLPVTNYRSKLGTLNPKSDVAKEEVLNSISSTIRRHYWLSLFATDNEQVQPAKYIMEKIVFIPDYNSENHNSLGGYSLDQSNIRLPNIPSEFRTLFKDFSAEEYIDTNVAGQVFNYTQQKSWELMGEGSYTTLREIIKHLSTDKMTKLIYFNLAYSFFIRYYLEGSHETYIDLSDSKELKIKERGSFGDDKDRINTLREKDSKKDLLKTKDDWIKFITDEAYNNAIKVFTSVDFLELVIKTLENSRTTIWPMDGLGSNNNYNELESERTDWISIFKNILYIFNYDIFNLNTSNYNSLLDKLQNNEVLLQTDTANIKKTPIQQYKFKTYDHDRIRTYLCDYDYKITSSLTDIIPQLYVSAKFKNEFKDSIEMKRESTEKEAEVFLKLKKTVPILENFYNQIVKSYTNTRKKIVASNFYFANFMYNQEGYEIKFDEFMHHFIEDGKNLDTIKKREDFYNKYIGNIDISDWESIGNSARQSIKNVDRNLKKANKNSETIIKSFLKSLVSIVLNQHIDTFEDKEGNLRNIYYSFKSAIKDVSALKNSLKKQTKANNYLVHDITNMKTIINQQKSIDKKLEFLKEVSDKIDPLIEIFSDSFYAKLANTTLHNEHSGISDIFSIFQSTDSIKRNVLFQTRECRWITSVDTLKNMPDLDMKWKVTLIFNFWPRIVVPGTKVVTIFDPKFNMKYLDTFNTALTPKSQLIGGLDSETLIKKLKSVANTYENVDANDGFELRSEHEILRRYFQMGILLMSAVKFDFRNFKVTDEWPEIANNTFDTLCNYFANTTFSLKDVDKYLYLYGQGGAGKTSLIDMVADSLGSSNVYRPDINSDSNQNNFSNTKLKSILMYVKDDISVEDPNALKQIVNSSYQLDVEQKHINGNAAFPSYFSLIILSNESPTKFLSDKALQRRIIPIEVANETEQKRFGLYNKYLFSNKSSSNANSAIIPLVLNTYINTTKRENDRIQGARLPSASDVIVDTKTIEDNKTNAIWNAPISKFVISYLYNYITRRYVSKGVHSKDFEVKEISFNDVLWEKTDELTKVKEEYFAVPFAFETIEIIYRSWYELMNKNATNRDYYKEQFKSKLDTLLNLSGFLSVLGIRAEYVDKQKTLKSHSEIKESLESAKNGISLIDSQTADMISGTFRNNTAILFIPVSSYNLLQDLNYKNNASSGLLKEDTENSVTNYYKQWCNASVEITSDKSMLFKIFQIAQNFKNWVSFHDFKPLNSLFDIQAKEQKTNTNITINNVLSNLVEEQLKLKAERERKKQEYKENNRRKYEGDEEENEKFAWTSAKEYMKDIDDWELELRETDPTLPSSEEQWRIYDIDRVVSDMQIAGLDTKLKDLSKLISNSQVKRYLDSDYINKITAYRDGTSLQKLYRVTFDDLPDAVPYNHRETFKKNKRDDILFQKKIVEKRLEEENKEKFLEDENKVDETLTASELDSEIAGDVFAAYLRTKDEKEKNKDIQETNSKNKDFELLSKNLNDSSNIVRDSKGQVLSKDIDYDALLKELDNEKPITPSNRRKNKAKSQSLEEENDNSSNSTYIEDKKEEENPKIDKKE